MLTLQPESSQWDLRPEILTLPIGVLNSATDLFDTFEVEAGEGLAPDVERVLLATSTRSDGLLITPAASVTDLDGKPAILGLATPGYAIAFDTTPGDSV